MASGSYGTSMTMFSTRQARPANCKQCPNGRTVDDTLYCMQYGNINPRRRMCKHYEGPRIKTKRGMKYKRTNKKGKTLGKA